MWEGARARRAGRRVDHHLHIIPIVHTQDQVSSLSLALTLTALWCQTGDPHCVTSCRVAGFSGPHSLCDSRLSPSYIGPPTCSSSRAWGSWENGQ